MKLWKTILLISGSVLLVLIMASLILGASMTRKAEPAVDSYLVSSAQVLVENDRWLAFRPVDGAPQVGFIFYPGGNVDYLAYAPPLYAIAEQGFLVVDVPMPFDLAVISPDKAQKVIDAYPEIETWVIGGHSLGGAMAARFIDENPTQVDGLVLWAAFPAESNSLAETSLPVLSLYGTLDGVSPPRRIERRINLLPEDTVYLALEGGNHAQFGYYGPQRGDSIAEISREEQQALVIDATVDFLTTFNP